MGCHGRDEQGHRPLRRVGQKDFSEEMGVEAQRTRLSQQRGRGIPGTECAEAWQWRIWGTEWYPMVAEQREVGCVTHLENGQALCQVGSEAAVRPLHPQCSGTARLTL